MDHPLRLLPSIKAIQDSEVYIKWKKTASISETYLTALARDVVEEERQALIAGKPYESKEEVHRKILTAFDKRVRELLEPLLTQVVNATGVVLHTNLGRARLSAKAADAARVAGSSYTDLEFDLEQGNRGARTAKIEALLRLLTGAESAMIVNNNAAAVFMILRTFAKGKEVLVSRGELVEIGGSFRVSSIMAESDAQLIEVGTTNKTRIEDYAENLTENTAMVMKVHQSNFKIIGFTEAASRHELAELAAKHGLLFYEDLGSGALFDYSRFGIGKEPIIPNIIKEGVDLLSASGDKLFGGPQAGIILGKKHLIDRLKKHPLARTFRTDKMTIASLGVTLQSYLSEKLEVEIPTVRDVVADAETIKNRAIKLKKVLTLYPSIQAEIVPLTSRVGGGAMPDVPLKSYGVKIQSPELPAQTLADRLRTGKPSVIGRIEEAHVLLDCRTIADEEIDLVGQAFAQFGFEENVISNSYDQ